MSNMRKKLEAINRGAQFMIRIQKWQIEVNDHEEFSRWR